jgi:hypothetical protein
VCTKQYLLLASKSFPGAINALAYFMGKIIKSFTTIQCYKLILFAIDMTD